MENPANQSNQSASLSSASAASRRLPTLPQSPQIAKGTRIRIPQVRDGIFIVSELKPFSFSAAAEGCRTCGQSTGWINVGFHQEYEIVAEDKKSATKSEPSDILAAMPDNIREDLITYLEVARYVLNDVKMNDYIGEHLDLSDETCSNLGEQLDHFLNRRK